LALHAKALPGNPYDGRTLATTIEATARFTGCVIVHGYLEKGYRGHHAPNPCRFVISPEARRLPHANRDDTEAYVIDVTRTRAVNKGSHRSSLWRRAQRDLSHGRHDFSRCTQAAKPTTSAPLRNDPSHSRRNESMLVAGTLA
jgi:hypothetical protein